jgi:hypothetical protein
MGTRTVRASVSTGMANMSRRIHVGAGATLLVALLCVPSASSGRHATRATARKEKPCAQALAPLPPVDVGGAIRPGLERYLTQYVGQGWGWSIGDGAKGLVMVGLPPGCGALADRIESQYGAAVHVDRDVLIELVNR